jgi:hypothetical protein
LALGAGDAFAQDAATGAALFDKGVSDMLAGHFESACPALEESEQLDPHPGTLFTLAECQAKWGKVASAVARYQDYVGVVSRLGLEQRARHRDRVAIANAQLTKLKPTVPTLTLVLPTNAPVGMFATRNGVVLQGPALGLALPVDPGDYVIVSHVPGAGEHSLEVSIALGETKRVELEVPAKQAAATSPRTPRAAAGQKHDPDPLDRPQRNAATPNTAAYVVGAVGVAGVALGSVAGLLVFGKRSTVKTECAGTSCSPAGLEAASSAKNLGMVSNIAFGVGIAGLATSVILFLTHDTGEAQAPAARTSWEPLFAGTSGGAWAGLGRRW